MAGGPSKKLNEDSENSSIEQPQLNEPVLLVDGDKKKVNYGEMEFILPNEEDATVCKNVFIASKDSKFKVGNRTYGSRNFCTEGKIIFFNDAHKKCYKIEIFYSVNKSVETSRYISPDEIFEDDDFDN